VIILILVVDDQLNSLPTLPLLSATFVLALKELWRVFLGFLFSLKSGIICACARYCKFSWSSTTRIRI